MHSRVDNVQMLEGEPTTRGANDHRSPDVREVLYAFTKLGLTSFGGPAAHLGFFRTEFVERRRWLDDKAYGELVALCQFLPGPASSQVGMALGLRRAGWAGALAAWVGFTLPSAFALILFAYGATEWPWLASSGAVHGLKLVAVAVVAQAVLAMAKVMCRDRLRLALAISAALLVLAVPTGAGQMSAIALGAVAGRWILKAEHRLPVEHQNYRIRRRTGVLLLGAFGLLLAMLPALAGMYPTPWLQAIAVFYRAGALVFGGGHVVLPLLQAGVVPPGWVSNDAFLAGYGAAQAVPGPLFSFAAFLGAQMPPPFGGITGGIALLVVIFVPAFLLVAGTLPFWESMRQREGVQRAIGGVNAVVVGILGAAFYDPVWTSAIHNIADFGLAIAAFGLLTYARVPPVMVVAIAPAAGWALTV